MSIKNHLYFDFCHYKDLINKNAPANYLVSESIVIINKTEQGTEYIFKNKFIKSRMSKDDFYLNNIIKLEYNLCHAFPFFRRFFNKSKLHAFDCFFEKRYQKLDENDQKNILDNVDLTDNDLSLKRLVIYDLIPKEYISDYKNRYLKFKEQFSENSFTSRSVKEVTDSLDKMEFSRVIGSHYNIDHFYFGRNSSLFKYFNRFGVEAIGLSESFYIIKYTLFINNYPNEIFHKIINDSVYKDPICISNGKWWNKKSFYGLSYFGTDTSSKAYAVDDLILELKFLLWREIKKFLPSKFFNWKNIPPSIEIYSSDTIEKNYEDILSVLAYKSYGRVEHSKESKTFFIFSSNQFSSEYSHSSKIVSHCSLFDDSGHGMYDYWEIDRKICTNFADYFLLDAIRPFVSKLIYQTQLKINKDICQKNQFHSLLKLKQTAEKRLYFYKRLYDELSNLSESEPLDFPKAKEYDKLFFNYIKEKNPEFTIKEYFINRYFSLFVDIKEKNILIKNIYKHFDENSKIVESIYNYKIIKWTFIVTLISLFVTIILSNNTALFETIKNSLSKIIELFAKK